MGPELPQRPAVAGPTPPPASGASPCKVCGHAVDAHTFGIYDWRCLHCPGARCQDGPDGRRLRAETLGGRDIPGEIPDLIFALSRLLAAWDLHHLIADWDGEHGWRHLAPGKGNTGAGQDRDDRWLHVVTNGGAGIRWEDGRGGRWSASWPDVRRLLRHIPGPLAADLADAYAEYRMQPRGWDRDREDIARGAYVIGELEAARLACWAFLYEANRRGEIR